MRFGGFLLCTRQTDVAQNRAQGNMVVLPENWVHRGTPMTEELSGGHPAPLTREVRLQSATAIASQLRQQAREDDVQDDGKRYRRPGSTVREPCREREQQRKQTHERWLQAGATCVRVET
jgi:hypothetical protein